MSNILKRKSVWVTAVSLTVLFVIVSITNIGSYNHADAEVEVLLSPNPSRSPDPVPPNGIIKLTLTAGTDAPDVGQQIAVWDSRAVPVFTGSNCAGFELSAAGGVKWELRADTDAAGAGNRADFLDGTSLLVGYTLPTPNVSKISLIFGDGGTVTPTLEGGATITPAAPLGGFAWIDVTGSLAVPSPPPGPGSDKTYVILPTPDLYVVASCGTDNVREFGTQFNFGVDLPSTELTKTAAPTSGSAPLPVTYTYTETNTADINLKNVVVNDDTCDPVPGGAIDPIFPEGDVNRNGINEGGETWTGDINDNGILNPGETWTFKCSKTFTVTGTFTNTAFVTATVCSDNVVTVAVDCDLSLGQHSGATTCVPSTVPIVNYPICDPNELDDATVRVNGEPPGKVVKTIHAEKQTFDGFLPQGNIPVIIDVTIIVEIYQDMGTQSIIQKQVVVVTCMKQETPPSILGCESYVPSQDIVPVRNCSEIPVQYPPVMNTTPGAASESEASNMNMNTIVKGNTAKTVEAQKEVFICTFADGPDSPTTPNPNDKKVDLLLFTEIYQNLNTQTSDDPQIFSVKCVIKIEDAIVESCRFKDHPV